MGVKGVIFDLDGTLADTLADIAHALNFALTECGYAMQAPQTIRQWIGDGLSVLCQRAAGNGAADVEALAFAQHYDAHRLDHVAPYDGVAQVLADLEDRGIPKAVLSNKPHRHTGPMVQALFGEQRFVEIVGAQEDDRRKPDPRNAQDIIRQMGVPAERVLLIGDSAIDVNTAHNAGAVAVGVTWGFCDRPELEASGARHIIDHPAELVVLL